MLESITVISYQELTKPTILHTYLHLCLLGNIACFLTPADYMYFSKSSVLKNSFRNAIRVSNSLDPDQARHYVAPDLGPHCSQRLSADDNSKQRIIVIDKAELRLGCTHLNMNEKSD